MSGDAGAVRLQTLTRLETLICSENVSVLSVLFGGADHGRRVKFQDVKKAYRRMVMIVHPDRCGHELSDRASFVTKCMTRAFEQAQSSKDADTRSRGAENTSFAIRSALLFSQERTQVEIDQCLAEQREEEELERSLTERRVQEDKERTYGRLQCYRSPIRPGPNQIPQ